jgi:hypothetical protein
MGSSQNDPRCEQCGCLYCRCTPSPAAPAPDPVTKGWLSALSDAYHCGAVCAHTKEKLLELLTHLAAPAAPAPLTDEQIDRLIEHSDCWTGPGLGASFKKEVFARLVEQAHGIAATTKETK